MDGATPRAGVGVLGLALVIATIWPYLQWALAFDQSQSAYRYKHHIQSEYVPWMVAREKGWPALLDKIEQHLREHPTPEIPFPLSTHRRSKPALRVLNSDTSTFEGEVRFRWGSGQSYRISVNRPADRWR